jgi:hypothetical protein
MSVAVMALSFFLLNSNFYPQLLTYQAGRPLALMTKGKVNPGDVFFGTIPIVLHIIIIQNRFTGNSPIVV